MNTCQTHLLKEICGCNVTACETFSTFVEHYERTLLDLKDKLSGVPVAAVSTSVVGDAAIIWLIRASNRSVICKALQESIAIQLYILCNKNLPVLSYFFQIIK